MAMNTPDRRPILAIDGTESINGRALLTLSALYWCEGWLSDIHLRVIDVADDNVLLACRALEWDLGTTVEIRNTGTPASLAGADLYAGIGFCSADHMRLAEAEMLALPTLVALQFPDNRWCLPSILLREEEAFDPSKFADHLRKMVQTWL